MNKKARINYIHALSSQVERKKMYKAKKQWVVAGISFLVATGMGAIGSHLTTHAANVNNAPAMNTLANRGNASATSASSNQSTASNASKLHDVLVSNQVAKTNTSAKSTTPNVSKNDSASSSSESSNSSNHTLVGKTSPLSKIEVGESETSGQTQPSDNHWIFNNGKYLSDNQINDWVNQPIYRGLNWKYNQKAKAAEFTGGTAAKDMSFMVSKNQILKNVESIKFDDNVDMTHATNMNAAFTSSNIYNLDLGNNFNTKNVWDFTGMFGSMSNLIHLNLGSKFTTGPHADLGWMFGTIPRLQTITLPQSFNVSNASDLSNMFRNDYALKSLNLSSFNTSNAKNMFGMFNSDYAISDINLGSDFDTSNVSDMNGMFQDDHNLKHVYAGAKNKATNNLGDKFNTSKVTNMVSMFSSDFSLPILTLPDSFNTSNVSNMWWMFYDDPALATLSLGNGFDTRNCVGKNQWVNGNTGANQGMSYMFGNNGNAKTITNYSVPKGSYLQHLIIKSPNTKFNGYTKVPLIFRKNGDLQTINLADGNSHVGNFGSNKDLPDTLAPKNVSQTAQGMWNSAEWNLYANGQLDIHDGAINFNIPSIDWSKVHSIYTRNVQVSGNTMPSFDIYDMPNNQFQSIDLSGVDTSNVTSMSGLVESDTQLTSIILPKDTHSVTNMSSMLQGIAATHLDLSNLDTSNVSDFMSMIGTNNNLASLNLGGKFNTIKAKGSKISGIDKGLDGEAYMLSYDPKLSNVTLSKYSLLTPDANERGPFKTDPRREPVEPKFTNGELGNIKLNDGNQHQGTWYHNADLVHFTNGNNTVETKMYQPQNSTFTISSDDLDEANSALPSTQKYVLVNSQNPITPDGSEINVPVQLKDTDKVNFYDANNNGSYLSSTTKSGNDGSTALINLPTNYKIANSSNTTSQNITLSGKTHVLYVVPTKDNHTYDIPVVTKPVTFKGNVVLKFYNNKDGQGNPIKTIRLPYSIPTSVDFKVTNYLKNTTPSATIPTDYLNKVIQNFNTNNYSYDYNVNGTPFDNVYVDPSNSGAYDPSNNTYNNGTLTLNFSPNPATDTINYIVHDSNDKNNGKTLSSQTFTGNSNLAQSDNSSFTVDSSNDTNIPSGYHLVNTSTLLSYDGQKHPVHIVGNKLSDITVQYVNQNDQMISSGTISGNLNDQGNIYKSQGLTMPNGYHFVSATDNNENMNNATDKAIPYNISSNHQNIVIKVQGNPITVPVDLKYTIDGQDQTKLDKSFTVTKHVGDSNIIIDPKDYEKEYFSDPQMNDVKTIATTPTNSKNNQNAITFTYTATKPDVIVDYIDNTQGSSHYKQKVGTTQDLGYLGLAGQTVTLGAKGANDGSNVIDDLIAPTGYQLQNKKNLLVVKLQPNEPSSKGHTVVRLFAMLSEAPKSSKSNAASNSSASSANSSSAKPTSTSSNTSSSSNTVINNNYYYYNNSNSSNTNNTNDDPAISALASEVEQDNQTITTLSNNENSLRFNSNTSTSQASCSCGSAFSNILDNGINTLANDINNDFDAHFNNSNVHVQSVKPRRTVGKRTYSYLKWLRVVKPLKLYNANHEVVKTIRPKHRITLNVKAAYKVNNHIIFKISYLSHNYFIRANSKAIKNAYLPASHKLIGKRVRVLYSVYANKHKVSGRVKTLHRGYKSTIKNIVRIGSHNVTRIQLANGLWISANMNYVKVL